MPNSWMVLVKNFKTRCAGLSPALFLFAILGNGTYGLSICAKSMDRRYLIMNASWLAGESVTVYVTKCADGSIHPKGVY